MTLGLILGAVQQQAHQHHPVWEAVRAAAGGGAGWWIFSTAVQTMPVPRDGERWYGWFYTFVQRVAANHSLVHPADAEAGK